MIGSNIDDAFIQSVAEQYSDMIFRVSFQYVRDAQDAEDVVQDVLLELLERLFRVGFESDAHMKAWLIRVAVNKSKNLAKGNARRRKRETDYIAPRKQEAMQFDDLESALDKLSAVSREAVYLHYFEGYTAKEIAELIGKSEKAVLKCLSRSREKLKTYLSEEERA